MSAQRPAPASLLDFRGQVVLVTGAGSGIGEGIALRFAEAGAAVAVGYHRSKKGAQAVVSSIERSGGRARPIACDVTREDDVERMVSEAAASLGGLHVLVNNAGIYPATALLDLDAAAWDEVVAANLRSVHLCTRAAARRMNPGASIVNIASIEAENPAPMHAHYCAAKAGVVMYTRSAAQELGAKGIRVNCVSPGLIGREGLDEAWPEGVSAYKAAVPLGRLGTFEDVADACLFLASPAARWITGANLVVDGGVLTHRVY